MMEEMTECEVLVMKAIWSVPEPMSLQEITEQVNRLHHKKWKTQTVSTFLRKIVAKGYLRMERRGRYFLYYPLVTEDAYGKQEIAKCVDFWSNGKADRFLTALTQIRELTDEEKKNIKNLLDELD